MQTSAVFEINFEVFIADGSQNNVNHVMFMLFDQTGRVGTATVFRRRKQGIKLGVARTLLTFRLVERETRQQNSVGFFQLFLENL